MILITKKVLAMLIALVAQQEAMDKDFKPLGEMTGADTAIERPMAMMVTSEQEFIKLWYAHKELFGDAQNGSAGVQVAEAQVPKVDFKKNVVIAYFAGQTNGVLGYELADVNTKGKTNVVRILPQVLTGGPGLVNSTYGMWVFPIPKKAVELELIIGMDKNQPVVRKLGKFEPPKVIKG